MTDENQNDNKASTLSKHLSRVLLRMVPIVPGPELYDLLNDLTKSRTSIDQKITKAYDSLQETSTLISELEEGLKERVSNGLIVFVLGVFAGPYLTAWLGITGNP